MFKLLLGNRPACKKTVKKDQIGIANYAKEFICHYWNRTDQDQDDDHNNDDEDGKGWRRCVCTRIQVLNKGADVQVEYISQKYTLRKLRKN